MFRLAEGDRRNRRSLADALEVIKFVPHIQDLCARGETTSPIAQVKIGPMRLPSGEVVGLVDLIFPALDGIVSLPTAARFRAATSGGGTEWLLISMLDGAIVQLDGTVYLANGTSLRDVVIEPSVLPYEPSDLDYGILRHVLIMTNSMSQCYRSIRQGLPKHLRKGLPKRPLIDFRALPAIKRPALKEIARYFRRHVPSLKNVSHQKIADALATFGIRGTRKSRHCAP